MINLPELVNAEYVVEDEAGKPGKGESDTYETRTEGYHPHSGTPNFVQFVEDHRVGQHVYQERY